MGLILDFINVPVREFSGASSDRKFDFQKDWGIYHMIQMYEDDEDFIMCFEYHDDIVVFDSEKKPTKVEFYQVKSREEPLNLTFLAGGKARKLGTKSKIELSNYKNYKLINFLIVV